MNLNHPITYIKGVSVARAELLYSELGIRTCNDLLSLFPFRYIDKTQFYTINQLQQNSSEVQIVGKIRGVKTVKQKRGSRLVATFYDATGSIELVWFKGAKWIKDSLKIDTPYVIYGKLNWYNSNASMPHPEMETVREYKSKLQMSMQPVYPSTEKLTNKGISNKMMRTMIQNLLQQVYNSIEEALPTYMLNENQLLGKRESLLNIHFPKSQELLAKAQYRLKFEELFFIQVQLLQKKLIRKSKIKGYVFEHVGEEFTNFYNNHLPFSLTNAQKRVLKEIRKDVGSGAHMNRLLQGDVGSGKTIVALLSMLIAIDNGYQATIMAPTEILAIQHYNGIVELLSETSIKVELLTGSSKTKKRREIHQGLEDGTLHILIGTHAILEDKVQFKNLGISIIDEQHRFGVAQRSKMWQKNDLPPHVLVMTATPIPRTLAMSVYGDLDISVIDELPPGRKEIKTVHRYDSNRLGVFKFLKDEIAKGRQAYVVYPLIQESEAMDYKDLMDGYESIVRDFPSPKYQISIVHGQMKPADKEYEMDRFVNGETQIMVATTVIEVGVNVPNASVMVIESAERFGLSQLHQLRGRVGRGAEQSYCILLSSYKLSSDGKTRLQTMVDTTDGFKIAEVDLKLRGPGNIMGTQQSGVLNLKIADVVKDSPILHVARQMAIKVLQEDPALSKPEHRGVLKTYTQLQKTSGLWSNIS
ncbi:MULTISPECIES: ATP-dependent DNA helicase RecG [unclassified Tenacibaculum]|uniref:ATP-dependent DNA helicase RecG n=1 Tax=unclassified Tenacibaculum TaxID=2635139 RepID=UPI001F337609|nr:MULTISPECIES: ATP-dependent DNA helicase RecG [unclassified Tenacibaculum]MCF2874212.1 ATP-dependent DNA helicase RecG [Tenacibaculum sp. Cn5-1]MCF2934793.1 ATP-dependent DNA helicase RecG [Tenacibaculum sp. Cn5-34]MCG7511003.1 ATP-dependent DNA helicase RecG [Tenacibaculum sp. Cn5-46]